MPSILGANTLSGGYEVANSVRFNSADSAQMNKTLGTATDVDKYTISMWVKRARLGHRQMMMRVIDPSSTGTYAFYISVPDQLYTCLFYLEASEERQLHWLTRLGPSV